MWKGGRGCPGEFGAGCTWVGCWCSAILVQGSQGKRAHVCQSSTETVEWIGCSSLGLLGVLWLWGCKKPLSHSTRPAQSGSAASCHPWKLSLPQSSHSRPDHPVLQAPSYPTHYYYPSWYSLSSCSSFQRGTTLREAGAGHGRPSSHEEITVQNLGKKALGDQQQEYAWSAARARSPQMSAGVAGAADCGGTKRA